MVEVGGRPVLWHIMKIYSFFGFSEFVLCLGYKGEVIRNFFYNYDVLSNDFSVELGGRCNITSGECHKKVEILGRSRENWRVTLADTGESALKGARVKRVEKYVDGDTFMLTYGDGVADVNIRELLEFHKKHGKIGTVTGVRPLSRFGEIATDGSRVSSFVEKPQVSKGLINGGFFVLNRKVFDYLRPDDDCDFERGPLEELAKKGELMVYEHKGEWECMDTYRDMQYLNSVWNKGNAFWKVWKD
jgi:glucose-1-phosphate cytidylyltransferase